MTITLEHRYWKKVIITDKASCWRWTGAKNEHGYGVIGRGSRGQGNEKAHRVSWRIHFGDIPEGMDVCHKCDNPECTNPNHLFLGTHQENMKDMVSKGRNAHGECAYAKLAESDVEEIRTLYSTGAYSQYKLASIYRVSRSEIQLIVTRKRWTHVN